jgi:hypothetical protein
LDLRGGQAESGGEFVGSEGEETATVFAGVFVVAIERGLRGAVVRDDVESDALEGANGADGFVVGSFMSDHVTFGGVLLVVEPEATEVEGRVITRVRRRVDDGVVMLMKEVDVFEAERFGLRVFGFGFRVFTGAEEEEVAKNAHVLDAPPFIWGAASRGRHVVQFVDDGGVDWPDSVCWRIFSGKGLEHFADSGVQ